MAGERTGLLQATREKKSGSRFTLDVHAIVIATLHNGNYIVASIVEPDALPSPFMRASTPPDLMQLALSQRINPQLASFPAFTAGPRPNLLIPLNP